MTASVCEPWVTAAESISSFVFCGAITRSETCLPPPHAHHPNISWAMGISRNNVQDQHTVYLAWPTLSTHQLSMNTLRVTLTLTCARVCSSLCMNKQGVQPTLLYTAQFSHAADGGRYIAAGGSGANEAKVCLVFARERGKHDNSPRLKFDLEGGC